MNASESAALLKKIVFSGTITAVTGLHIGGTEAGLAIGGADKVVVRDPRTNAPYVPGSSLKGRMRSLLEKAHCTACDGFVNEPLQCGPCKCGTCPVCLVFGVSASEAARAEGKPHSGAARLLVRDAFLGNRDAVARMPNLATDLTEVKTEVSIDRLTSQATPRNFERVPAGAEFQFELVLNLFRNDAEAELRDLVLEGLRLVAFDALGGQSSRGYGHVEIRVERENWLEVKDFASDAGLQAALGRNRLAAPLTFGSLNQLERGAA